MKPSTEIVSKAQEFVDIYRFPPHRPSPIYPTPQPDKPAAKCRKDVCLLPDCNCGGPDIPGNFFKIFLIKYELKFIFFNIQFGYTRASRLSLGFFS